MQETADMFALTEEIINKKLHFLYNDAWKYRSEKTSKLFLFDTVHWLLIGGSRTAATSKKERFVIIVNGWKPLTIITKYSILDVASVLDPPLTTHFRWTITSAAIYIENKNIWICNPIMESPWAEHRQLRHNSTVDLKHTDWPCENITSPSYGNWIPNNWVKIQLRLWIYYLLGKRW